MKQRSQKCFITLSGKSESAWAIADIVVTLFISFSLEHVTKYTKVISK